ncbi:NAD(P)-dependent oxidoreductase [Curtobacterium sp. MCPF17_002]|uniref:NAD-dependent epimerase/dehydratase family protein n=1 Tax=Curtobacterium sp. MCPF17_002 TaxID=2175645 RepID=UPI0015E89CCB|nr:NAD(P)-dependent oxidoreductase [Curtobacterium sp. MCPF17_002]WIB76358.1 NAD(P)-dependent oxidoreductase [Curtobacterium sp. MCPF17_002]
MTDPSTLVVGAGGFLGGAVHRSLTARGTDPVAARVPWDDQDAAVSALVHAVRGLRSGPAPWRLLWCAGTGVVATGAEVFDEEQRLIARVLDATRDDRSGPGTVFFASSAGAVYAGSDAPPFDEGTEPAPLAPYGHAKLAAEAQFRGWADATGARLVVGRISNLYGPGANLRKPQGLVSQLTLAHLEGRPSSIYVPMSTTRDYLYIDDAVDMVLQTLDLVEQGPSPAAVTKILSSGQPATIADVIDAVEQAIGTRLDIREGADPSATFQGLDLRMRSAVLPQVGDRTFVPFRQGVATTVDAIRAHRAPIETDSSEQ